MNRDAPFDTRIAFRLPATLHEKLTAWAQAEDRPLANLIYTVVKQAVNEREHSASGVQPTRAGGAHE